jgi:hypothetical protein
MNEQMIEAVAKAIFDAAAKKYSDNVTEKWSAERYVKVALAAAEPLIRAQVFQEIRAAAEREDVRQAVRDCAMEHMDDVDVDWSEIVLSAIDQIERAQKP